MATPANITLENLDDQWAMVILPFDVRLHGVPWLLRKILNSSHKDMVRYLNGSDPFSHRIEAVIKLAEQQRGASVQLRGVSVIICIQRSLPKVLSHRLWIHFPLATQNSCTCPSLKAVVHYNDLIKKWVEGGPHSVSGSPFHVNKLCSYPSVFVVASNIELESTGSTSHLESKLEVSRTEANLKIGYGPFLISGSHSQSNNSATTPAAGHGNTHLVTGAPGHYLGLGAVSGGNAANHSEQDG
ncbi:hypothetical protein CHU98_g1356 [Xylaria longipes]|nr:hypothetical protein CHU98_g1356 [Xylaria longipes]